MQYYKINFARISTVLGLASVLSFSAYAQQSKSAPSYEETVAWLQGISSRPFVEINPCEFSHENISSDRDQKVHFGKLSSTGMALSNYGTQVTINCAKGDGCKKSGEDTYDKFYFFMKNGGMGDRAKKALRHLTILCGATVINEDTF